jgi:secreted trypsin-like serine protease
MSIPPRQIAPSEIIDAATDARAVGFGNTDPTGFFGYGIKRQTDVPIASNSCQGDVDGNDDQTVYGCDPNLELIAGKPLLARDTCTGDSGGPLYIEGQDGWLLAGATSRATRGAINNCGDGGVYVRVDQYQDWLQSIADVKLD